MLLLCVLAPVGVVTGCGGGNSGAAKPPAAKHASTTTAPLAVRVHESIVACRKQVGRSTYIPASEKPAAKADCNGIKTGNITPLRRIFGQACLQAVAKLPPADQPPASKACRKAYGS